MAKKGAHVLVKFFVVVFIFVAVNFALFTFSFGRESIMTGNSIKNAISSAYSNLTFNQKIILLIQLIIFLSIIIFIFVKEIGYKSKKHEITGQELQKHATKNGTDLDVLLGILKDKKKLHLVGIADAFQIDKEVAMDWAKTLESSDLATIEYPALGEPVVVLKEDEEESEENEEKDKKEAEERDKKQKGKDRSKK